MGLNQGMAAVFAARDLSFMMAIEGDKFLPSSAAKIYLKTNLSSFQLSCFAIRHRLFQTAYIGRITKLWMKLLKSRRLFTPDEKHPYILLESTPNPAGASCHRDCVIHGG